MHTYIFKGNIKVPNTDAQGTANRNKKVVFKNCAAFIDCISQMNNAQLDDAHDIDVVMPMYYLLEYGNIYSKPSGSLWQNYRGETALNNNDIITCFSADNNNSISFKFLKK